MHEAPLAVDWVISTGDIHILWEHTYRQNGSQGCGYEVTISRISEAVAIDILGDVQEEFVEVSHLEEFVECDQLEVGDAFVADDSWWWTIWERAMSGLLDQRQLAWTWVGHAVGKFMLDRSWSFCGSCRDGRSYTKECNDRE